MNILELVYRCLPLMKTTLPVVMKEILERGVFRLIMFLQR